MKRMKRPQVQRSSEVKPKKYKIDSKNVSAWEKITDFHKLKN